MQSRFGSTLFFLYLIFGLYLLNASIKFVKMPKFMSEVDSWIFLISGILLIIGGLISLRVTSRRYRY